ncbi:hypothetical protein G7054_g11146 [Neopestalotiopsis clavispora]|nr:hypothetical protein G7054_g11146 [Neopestalotiopsis clavispora]
MQYALVAAALALGVTAAPGPVITAAPKALKALKARDSLPASSGSSTFSAAKTIAAGDSFDGGMYAIDRGVSCTGQEEGGDSDAVFILEEGASLSNVIIGPNQIEGVHQRLVVGRLRGCLYRQGPGQRRHHLHQGRRAFGAEDKVIQHNGGGTISISDFTVSDFGKLYRSCGNCDDMYERHVIISGVSASDGSSLAGINENYGDSATFSDVTVSDVDDICVTYEGNDSGEEPTKTGSGADGTYCIYDESDITES